MAVRESFHTWLFLGSVILQLSSHNRFRSNLLRDALVVVVVTASLVVLSGLTGVAMTQTLAGSGYVNNNNNVGMSNSTCLSRYKYVPSSFETRSSYRFLSSSGNGKVVNGHAKGGALDDADSAYSSLVRRQSQKYYS